MSEIQYTLRDTETVTIRPLELDDVPLIDAMHDRISKDSLYCRYFTTYKPSLDVLFEQARLCSYRGAAFVAVLQNPLQEIVGLAYYICTSDGNHEAEPALLIEDCFQGQGLGWAMMDLLLKEAQANGVSCFRSFVIPGNQRIFRILEKSGLPMHRHYCDGIFEVKLDLLSDQSILKISQHEMCVLDNQFASSHRL